MNFSKRIISIAASLLLLASFQHQTTIVVAGTDEPTSAPSEPSTSTSSPSSEATADPTIEIVPVVGDSACPGCYWVYGGKGDFVTCNSGDYALGMCGTGKDNKCSSGYSGIKCSPNYPGGSYPNSDVGAEEDMNKLGGESAAGWLCNKSGVSQACPYGQVVTGICGTNEHNHCAQYCPDGDDYSFGIKCEAAPANQFPPNDGSDVSGNSGNGWMNNQDAGEKYQCPSGTVLCGACMCTESSGCACGAFMPRCCTPSQFQTVGYWKPITEISGSTSITLTVGMTLSETNSQTSTWSDSVTDSVSFGLQVEGAGSMEATASETWSETVSSTYSTTWSVSATESIGVNYDATENQGYHVYQWVTQITDNLGKTYSTGTAVYTLTPPNTEAEQFVPKCYPEADAGANTYYQTCTENGYLPGFNSTSTRQLQSLSNDRRGGLRGGRHGQN